MVRATHSPVYLSIEFMTKPKCVLALFLGFSLHEEWGPGNMATFELDTTVAYNVFEIHFYVPDSYL